MKDVQNFPADVALDIDRVGVKNLELPIVVRDRAKGRQHTVAKVEISADLPAAFKGTHMSRFVEALEAWTGELDHAGVRALLKDVASRLQAQRAYVVFEFPFFKRKNSPASGISSLMSYDCRLTCELNGNNPDTPNYLLFVDVPVMTVCPCSLALCEEQGGAHSQRASVRIRSRFTGLLWLEDLIAIAEDAGSSPVYSLLKREDEKKLTEDAFANPTFVEDVVRKASQSLSAHPQVTWYRVEVESFESIHNHSAYAIIESPNPHD